jgi:hypothetical protein
LSTNREGAEIRLDGKPVGTSPLEGELFLDPGEHKLVASLSGHEAVERTLQVSAGAAARRARIGAERRITTVDSRRGE